MFGSYPRAYFELLSSAFTLLMSMSLASAFLPIFAYELDPSGVLVGLVTSTWFLSRVFTEFPSGILADKMGRRRLLAVGLSLSALGASLCSLANLIYVLMLGRAFWGLGTGLFFISSSAIIFDLFPSRIRGRSLGTFQAIEFIGSFIGAPVGGFIAAFTGYRSVFLVATGLATISCLIVLISKGLRQIDHGGHRTETAPLNLKDVLPRFNNWSLTTVYVCSFTRMLIWMGVTGTVFPLYLNLELSITVEMIGIIASIRTLGIIMATAASGRLSDSLGRKPIIILGMLLEAGCLYTYTATSLLEAVIFISFAEGVGRGMILTCLMALLSDIAPLTSRGAAIGVYRTFMDIGGFTGPLFFMLIYEKVGSHPVFASAAIIILINMAIILTIKTPKDT